jgi:hypothetical protein
VPHQEVNPSPDQPTQWVVVRNGREAIVVNLAKAPDGEYSADGVGKTNTPVLKESYHV